MKLKDIRKTLEKMEKELGDIMVFLEKENEPDHDELLGEIENAYNGIDGALIELKFHPDNT